MQKKYRTLFILAGAVMIWLGVKLLLAALSAAAVVIGAVMIFAGMRVITRSGGI